MWLFPLNRFQNRRHVQGPFFQFPWTWLELWIQNKHLKPSKGCLVNHGVKPHPFPSEKAPTTHPTNPPHHHLRHVAHLPQHPARAEAMIHGCRAIILPSRAVEGCLERQFFKMKIQAEKWRNSNKRLPICVYFVYLHRYTITGKCWHKENLLRSYSIYLYTAILLKICRYYDLTRHMNRTCHTLPNTNRAWCGGHLCLR